MQISQRSSGLNYAGWVQIRLEELHVSSNLFKLEFSFKKSILWAASLPKCWKRLA